MSSFENFCLDHSIGNSKMIFVLALMLFTVFIVSVLNCTNIVLITSLFVLSMVLTIEAFINMGAACKRRKEEKYSVIILQLFVICDLLLILLLC